MIPDQPNPFAFVLACAIACGSPPMDGPKTAPATPPTTEPDLDPEGPINPPVEPPSKGSANSLFVRDKTAACHGEGPMRCLQVRTSETSEWEWFYDEIEGFDYEEGNRYELRVEVTDVQDPPADGSSKKYRLLEVVSKEKAE